jgi:hypothetical protein
VRPQLSLIPKCKDKPARWSTKLIAKISLNFNAMDLVQLFFLLLTGASLIFLMIGLYKPWTMLWWEDVLNRRKVIKVYGGVAIVCYATYWVLRLFF